MTPMATPTDLTVWSRIRPLLPYVMTTVLFAACLLRSINCSPLSVRCR